MVFGDKVDVLADYLIANGVTFATDANDDNKSVPVSEQVEIHAHWIIDDGGQWAECSRCHEDEKIAEKVHKDFCGACGAAMDEESVVIHP